MSATRGPRTRMCAISALARTIATPARIVVAASSEWVRVAGSTASRATAKSAAVDAKACPRRIRATRRTAGDLRDDDEGGVGQDDDPDLGGADRCMCLCEWWQDVREERVADDDEHDVGC